MKTRDIADFYVKVVDLVGAPPMAAVAGKSKPKEAAASRKAEGGVGVLEPPTGEWKELCDDLLELFSGNQAYALEWLTTPIRALGHRSPLDVALHDEGGLTEVIHIIGRIEDGVYS